MDELNELQARGAAIVTDGRARRLTRGAIEENLLAAGFTRNDATDLLDGVPLEEEAPEVAPPSLDEVVQHAAREILATEEGAPSDALPGRHEFAFWERVLGAAARDVLGASEVTDAIAADHPLRLWNVLRNHARYARSAASRTALDRVLASRKLFVMTEERPPPLFYFRGIGNLLVARKKSVGADGATIGTVMFTFVFVPVVPIAQFAVAHVHQRSWHLIGRVPLARFYAWWQRLVIAGVAALVLLAILR